MIDPFNEIFTPIATKVRTQFSGAFVSGEYVEMPSSFPCATIVQMDNYTVNQDSSLREKYAKTPFEVNVYSNLKKGKRTQCKNIIAVIDDEFQEKGFTRIMCSEIPNINDATIFRIVARYTAVVSTDHTIYRR